MPIRLQRQRTRGWRTPTGAVFVGRGTIFGNPFTVVDALAEGFADTEDEARHACVVAHRDWLNSDPAYRDQYAVGGRLYDRNKVLAALPALAGHDLTCWCRPPARGQADICHAATLLAMAAQMAPR